MRGMAHRRRAPTARHRRRRIAALLVALAALPAALDDAPPETFPTPAATSPTAAPAQPRRAPRRRPRREATGLDPALFEAVSRAAADAAAQGVELRVVSGRRSAARQEQLLHEAVAKYGSLEEAARWVAPPETSAHVSGDAVDVGPAGAAAWLARHGAAYGLCRIYANEPWHFELRAGAAERGCPPMYPDPTHDPRMQR